MKDKFGKLFSKENKVKLALIGLGIVTGATITTVVIYKFPTVLNSLPNIQVEKIEPVVEAVASAA